ncbi:MAG: hypothetical protein GY874_00665 [Desulfobacteraceae bacterium]|nr:hypothetical protein [Desulfobacteraceae bacterium]
MRKNQKALISESSQDPYQEHNFTERRKNNRRQRTSKGYAYISMIGWICRREKSRRENDRYFIN